MSKYFRKVKCSERLPEKEGYYIVNSKCNSGIGIESADSLKFNFGGFYGEFANIPNWTHLWWLEEIELPSNDTMQELADVTYPKNAFEDEGKQRDYDLKRHGFKNGFNKAIELIKRK